MFKGKVAAVTGGGSGIGKACAVAFAKNGADVVILERNPERGLSVKGLIEEMRVRAMFIECDIAEVKNIPQIMDQIIENFGRIDIWLNNAGISLNIPTEELTEEQWDETLNINLKATFFWSQAAFKQMKAQGEGGRLIHISSIGAQRGAKFSGIHYVASKAGVLGVMKQLALNGGPHRITSNAVCPGQIDTEMTRNLNMSRDVSSIPLGRFGMPEDVAEAIIYLTSPQAEYITGMTIDVNGGMYIR